MVKNKIFSLMDFVKMWYVKPEVLTGVLMKIQVLCDVTPCRLVRSFPDVSEENTASQIAG
jgi:hypothetical protein